MGGPKGDSKKGDLKCSSYCTCCWCGIVVVSTRGGWSDDSPRIPGVTIRRRCRGFVSAPASILLQQIDFILIPTFPKILVGGADREKSC
jgi:hypothetical protein